MKIKDSKEEQDAYIKAFSKTIEDSLTAENLSYEIKGRPKSIIAYVERLWLKT